MHLIFLCCTPVALATEARGCTRRHEHTRKCELPVPPPPPPHVLHTSLLPAGRPNFQTILAKVQAAHPGIAVGVFYCGPPALGRSLKVICCMRAGVGEQGWGGSAMTPPIGWHPPALMPHPLATPIGCAPTRPHAPPTGHLQLAECCAAGGTQGGRTAALLSRGFLAHHGPCAAHQKAAHQLQGVALDGRGLGWGMGSRGSGTC